MNLGARRNVCMGDGQAKKRPLISTKRPPTWRKGKRPRCHRSRRNQSEVSNPMSTHAILLKCLACKLKYTDTWKPRIMTCFHTACEGCDECLTAIVERMSYGSILVVECSVCAEIIELSQAGIQELSEDIVVSALVDRDSENNIQCTFCTNERVLVYDVMHVMHIHLCCMSRAP